MELELTPGELAALRWIACNGEEVSSRRAHLLLMRDASRPVREICYKGGLSRGQAYYWLRSFQEKRLGAFPAPVLEAAQAEQARVAPSIGDGPDRKSPAVRWDDSMSTAGRKVLRFHFQHMLSHEPGTRQGAHIEELHDMRVATRRMRSAFRVFAPYFSPAVFRPLLKGLRRTGRVLGRVRDLDVFMEKAQLYLESLPEGEREHLGPLTEDWRERREVAHTRMLDHLDSKRYRRFVKDFRRFLTAEGEGESPHFSTPSEAQGALSVHQVVPGLIIERHDVVLGYDPLIGDASLETLHGLRVDCKRLRYTLEFFVDILGSEAKDAIKEVVRLQDHLGDLNDADVASRMLIGFLDQWSKLDRRDGIDTRGVASYLLTRLDELHTLYAAFPSRWRRFNRPASQQLLAAIVSDLSAAASQETSVAQA
ncbi:MAG TPA: CHAD domain-containing protein [Anaerolineae bacterium]|nr:CHAD domain-containing protein [Anaerolineae bacterium]